MRRPLFPAAALAALATAGCSLVLDPIEQRLLYRPWSSSPAYLASLASAENGVEEVRLKTADGVMLHGWLKHPRRARPVERFPLVIVFGGVRRETSWMIDRARRPDAWGWLFVNYRGYGLSEGAPSEPVVVDDARLVYDYAASRPDVDASNIVVLGRSLGSYVAVRVAATRPARAAILATPFDSLAAIGAKRYPYLPLGLLLGERYDSAAVAPSVKAPALFVFAEHDNVTPVENGAALASAWGGPYRTLTLAGARHYGIERREEFWRAVGDFLQELIPAGQRRVRAPVL
ncbi:MAG: dienelactone hydrolase family protein [Burkholderiales bacterium]|nr:dienelactone hydrolase family protein [Burkholderiales bacterium]